MEKKSLTPLEAGERPGKIKGPQAGFASIRVKLLRWFVLISIAPLAMLGSIVFFNSRSTLGERIKSELNISARGIAGKVSTFIEGKKGRTLDFCSDGIIKDGLTYYDADDPSVASLVKNTNQHLVKNKMSLDPYLEDILVLNLKGMVTFATNEKFLGKDKSKKDYFLAVAKYFKDKDFLKKLQASPTKLVYATDIYISDDLKAPILAISNIVTARATGLPLGVLVNRYKGGMLNTELEKESNVLGKGGKAFVVNKDGYLLTVPQFIDAQGKKDAILKEQIKTKPVIKAQGKGEEVLAIYKDSLGKSVLGVSIIMKELLGSEMVKPEAGSGWIVIAEKNIAEAFSSIKKLTGLIFGLGIICLAGVVFLALFISQKIANPILKLLGYSEDITKGDLTVAVNVESNDEIGRLASSFKGMVGAMHTMVSEVLSTADKVASSAEELSSSSEQMNASTQEVSSAIQQVAKGAGTQAERAAQASRLMEKSAVTLQQAVTNAQTTSGAVSQTSSRAQNGKIAAQEAVDKITQLTNTVVETAKVIQGLGEKSQAIGEITETITSIADQTNLLALNAAIEAARAGEAGRGFAVVAEEVRKLAEGSAEAVRKIGSLIKSIQTETQEAVSSMQASSREVQEGRAGVAKIADVLDEVNKEVQEVNRLAHQISTSIQQQVIDNEEVTKAVGEVSIIAKESAASAEEVSSSTEEQTASMQEMSASAQELSNLSTALKSLVSKFRVRSKS